ncbi:MAG: anmK [Phycisphaerales bacterium]|nr:anmK [Phycisphaerales bacterium]
MLERLFIGIMSGTSCDGVDAALVRVTGAGPAMRAAFLHLTSVDYAAETRHLIRLARKPGSGVRAEAQVASAVAERYADCVLALLAETGQKPAEITALAAHGQTLFHQPPLTVQAFDPSVLAERTKIDVISDFRRADCAAGGQGAPLVPFGDWVMFRASEDRVLLNLGGIANVTILPGGCGLEDVQGYDVGPANCLSDWLMRDHGGVDIGGQRASSGAAMKDVIDTVLADDFFTRPPPKSTDTPAMIALFEKALTARAKASLEDQLATANSIAAMAVQKAIGRSTGGRFVAGGGVQNTHLMSLLDAGTGPWRPTDALGMPTQAREAAAFALLGAAHLDRLPCYMPRVTGATKPALLGSFTPACRPAAP